SPALCHSQCRHKFTYNTAALKKFLSSKEPDASAVLVGSMLTPPLGTGAGNPGLLHLESNWLKKVRTFVQEEIMRKELRSLFVILLLAIPMLALANSPTAQPQEEKKQRSEANYREKLAKEVRHQLVMLPWYSAFDNLAYQVEGDKVILSGQVTRPTLKSDAEAAVKSIEAVSSVVYNIEVLPLSPMDDQIRRAVYRGIYRDPGLSRYSIQAVPFVHLRQRAAGAERRGYISHGVENGRAKAPRTQTVFFVVHGVT